ncbi:MAG: sigma-70 family RNA polymerase sigma factor, partial [Herminiimonas sp.]|nr:sigma-70 family RNA polymerase sigma factor [Herminiimonas sp.]
MRVDKNNKDGNFAAMALPHLNAAYNLARWLTGNDHGAEDIVQTAYLRAFRFFDDFRGDDARAWLLKIVRNTYYTALRDSRHDREAVPFDEEVHSAGVDELDISVFGHSNNPENILAGNDFKRAVNLALESLPLAFREVVVLKDIDDLSYKQIAEIVGIPIG